MLIKKTNTFYRSRSQSQWKKYWELELVKNGPALQHWQQSRGCFYSWGKLTHLFINQWWLFYFVRRRLSQLFSYFLKESIYFIISGHYWRIWSTVYSCVLLHSWKNQFKLLGIPKLEIIKEFIQFNQLRKSIFYLFQINNCQATDTGPNQILLLSYYYYLIIIILLFKLVHLAFLEWIDYFYFLMSR